MTPAVSSWVREMIQQFINSNDSVVEIGSLNINGGIKEFLPENCRYLGVDQREGPGVDLVCDARTLDVRISEDLDAVICLETLEHVDRFWEVLELIYRLLKPQQGIFIVSAPTFGFQHHAEPKDYWRFGYDAMREIVLHGYEILDITNQGFGGSVCGVGRKR